MLPTDAPSRWDALLAVIGASAVLAVIAARAFGVPLRVAGTAGAAVAAAAMVDGLLLHPPTDAD